MPSNWEKIVSITKEGVKSIGMIKQKIQRGKKIALLIDGPNILRKEFKVHLEDIVAALEELGNIRVAKVVLNQYAPQGLIEAIANQGFEPIIVAGETGVKLAVEAMREIYNQNIDIIALATRNAEFLPIILKAKEKGKETAIIGIEPGFSAALKHAADYVIALERGEDNENIIIQDTKKRRKKI
ncbi:MAG TPA: TIGR00288 family NYN domain-containing protein [Thermococcus sp.]|uniref:TIGR00288 family NYN domain-containing protein n=1 Tax=Thermococcus sp. TaxID=35749 RepID=UPI000BDC6992|nr:TIGR00288 family NYN domain-containing protein [Thermococcus sp.]OYT32361.1 MAG: TIGR00288 family protein [Archaeoglobales archaeon ex4484_92]RLF74709.1 MAG: TIGR00288 family NYN domain-containing protein [Thermococci archaeon]MCD6140235.1 TIGR00288 family NYN domain-containing protein [Thermococcus sp.]RLF79543.1 MAG: TIGR00288 family NYN domain-containing protein [Thermococci archaeon]RLF83573.1 MAG: TIGR00288 family NYN domain-containing protein [Thermococci archaeon]